MTKQARSPGVYPLADVAADGADGADEDLDFAFLAASLEPVEPPADVQARVLARVLARLAPQSSTLAAAPGTTEPLHTVRAGEVHWHTLAPDVDIKLLHDDGQFVSMLVRLQAGASLPPHGHPRGEECYVIEGDLWLSGVHLRAGDFQFASEGALHDDIRSDTGCLLHIRADRSMAAGLLA